MPERWKKIVNAIQADLKEDGIDNMPSNLPEIIAKIATGETFSGKGLLLMGNPGTGKTKRMRFIAKNLNVKFRSSLDIAKVAMEDPELLPEFCRYDNPAWGQTENAYFNLIVDDLGSEPLEIVIYGTRYNALADVLEKRYEKFPRAKTHISTNLTREQLRERYGERVYSRLNEMCAFVTLVGNDRRLQTN